MKNKILTIIKPFLFIVILAVTIFFVNQTVTAKNALNEAEPHTETYKGFYRMQKNTVDVLFLGSSHAASAFNPQDFYDHTGICSYNLAGSAQTLYNSYFWLKEALKYQHPKAVVLDCYYMFIHFSHEPYSRKVLDYMRPGLVKYEAAKANIEYDEDNKDSIISYFIPLIRYHGRWSELQEIDFHNNAGEITPPPLKGFWFYNAVAPGGEAFAPFHITPEDTETAEFDPLSEEYLNKILQLCRDHDITLILVKTPLPFFSIKQHNRVRQFADANQLLFYDFNTEELFHKAGLNYQTDMHNLSATFGHTNLLGARKISYFLADELVSNRLVRPVQDNQWELSRDFNDRSYNDFLLRNETDPVKYLKLLKNNPYTVFITVKDDAAGSMPAEVKEGLRQLGLMTDWNKDMFQHSYIAVLEQGNVTYEESSADALKYADSFRNGLSRIHITSSGYKCGNTCSVKIDDMEKVSNNTRGIHFIVYSNDRNCVVDSVGFDTNSPDLTVSR